MTRIRTNGWRLRFAASLLAGSAALCAGGAAVASGLEQPLDKAGRYQVFFGSPQAYESSAMAGQWRSIDHETRMLSGGQVNDGADAIGYSGPAGISYFTPRVTGGVLGGGLGAGLGIGLSGKARTPSEISEFARPTAVGGDDRNWHLGGSVGTSTVRVGAAFGDHVDPTCRETEACSTNDFWDVGVAWRFGSGALSAAYTASQRRTLGMEDPQTLGMFSVSAGYRVAPGLNVYGGVDWIELPETDGLQDQQRNTRFMLGTNLRF